MADSKLTALSEISIPAVEDLLYTVDDPGGTPVSNKVTTQRLLGQMFKGTCQCRLTTESGVPVSTSDRASQSTIYFTPVGGDAIALYDGTRWKLMHTAEVSLALSGLTSGKNYWVYAYDNAGTVTLELGAAWTTDTTSADTITTQDGVLVKSGTTTRRLVGLIRTTGTTTTEDSQLKRFVWSVYNQADRYMRVIDGTNSWSYATQTIRQANGSAANQVEYVTGDAAVMVDARLVSNVAVTTNGTVAALVGIGVDSAAAFSGQGGSGYTNSSSSMIFSMAAFYRGQPGIGYHKLCWNEYGADVSCQFYGDNGGTGLMQSGMDAVILG